MKNTLKCKRLHGTLSISGDKSISHRALILGAISTGVTTIENLSNSADVQQAVKILKLLGVRILYCSIKQQYKIFGSGLKSFINPFEPLYVANSGTAARLLIGLLASSNLNCIIYGDESLNKRPMQRIVKPLSLMGGQFTYQAFNGNLPLELRGNAYMVPITYELPIASAQIKSALMFAALNIKGCTTIIENITTRDHSELMFKSFKADIKIEQKNKQKIITICGEKELYATNIKVPGDFSSAAFLIVGALLTPNSHITIKNVGINPTRTGLLAYLQKMGGDIKLYNHQKYNNEDTCDIEVKSSKLKAIEILAEHNAIMIDEFPILAIAASLADGKTSFYGVEELKYKESNRLQAINEALQKCNVKCELENNNLHIWGTEPKNIVDTEINSYKDHRIAMSFLILALCSNKNIIVNDINMIDTSFKDFFKLLEQIGAQRKYYE